METVTDCAICVEEYSPNPHCRDCHRTWTRHSEAHCTICCNHFSSDRGFDLHLAPVRGDDTCFDPATIVRSDGTMMFEIIERNHGPVWRVADPREHPFAVSGEPLNGVNRAGAEL